MSWEALVVPALISAATAILMGRFLRRLIILPFEWWAGRTVNKVDDQLLEDAKKDLGLEDRKE